MSNNIKQLINVVNLTDKELTEEQFMKAASAFLTDYEKAKKMNGCVRNDLLN